MSAPWFKFYPTDWRSDPRLRMCSMAARGLWIEMIALMHEATPYGHLLVSGHSPTDTQLAVLAGTPPDQLPDLLGELESAGVFSRTSARVIYSRKMTRMAKQSALARKNGKSGGNPSLGKDKGNPPPVNPSDKPEDKPQKPEARLQSRDGKPSLEESARAALAGVVGDALAAAFIDHRKALRAPMTPHAGKLLAKRLASMADPGAALERAIERGWKSAFEDNAVHPFPKRQNDAERRDDLHDALKARLAVQRLE